MDRSSQTRLLAAATNNGLGGACLFAVNRRGRISFTQQRSPGGPWQPWGMSGFQSQPVAAAALVCAGQNDGCLLLVMLGTDGAIWICPQDSPSGVWLGWEGPYATGQHFSFKAIAAGEQSGGKGLQLIAVDLMDVLWSCAQTSPGGDWSGWSHFSPGGTPPSELSELVLTGQNDGCLMLMAPAHGQLKALPQTAPGGGWGAWTALPKNASLTSLSNICACQQGGNRGVQFWGLDSGGQIWSIFQDTPGGLWDAWEGPGFLDQPAPFTDLAAADQNNGSTMLAAVTAAGDVWMTGQQGAGSGWDPWHQIAAPLG